MPSAQAQHTDADPLVRAASLTKSYNTGRSVVELFRSLDFTIPRGELLAIVGESGAGKSTLLHLLAAMDTPTSGTVQVDGIDLSSLNAQAAGKLSQRVRRLRLAVPLPAAGVHGGGERRHAAAGAVAVRKAEALRRAEHWLDEVELSGRALHRSGELSGGEQQRVSLARALVTEPRLLLADELTGDLDNRTAGVVFSLLERLHRTHGLTSVLVTHHLGFAAKCDRTLLLRQAELWSMQRMLQAFEPRRSRCITFQQAASKSRTLSGVRLPVSVMPKFRCNTAYRCQCG